MRLAFNATALLSPLTGIGQYSFHLGSELLRLQAIEIEFFYGAYWENKLRNAPPSVISASLPWFRRHIPYSYELRRWIQHSQFLHGTKRRKFDLDHEPNILALDFDGPTVITVHDLSWIRHPETHPLERVKAMNRYFESGMRRADALITDSVFVKQELIDVFGVPEERISSIPLGVEAIFKPLDPIHTDEILNLYHLVHGRYFLAVGTLEPRKNLSLVLEAYIQLPATIRDKYPLVLIGMKGWKTTQLEQQIAPLICSGQVRQLGYLSRSDLAVLMAGATTLIYPSIYEGFGLPPLESMACATPVICANASSLPEVVGDVGVLFHPQDDEALIHAMIRIIEDKTWRDSLALRSRERAASFTWLRCAQETLRVYQSVVSEN